MGRILNALWKNEFPVANSGDRRGTIILNGRGSAACRLIHAPSGSVSVLLHRVRVEAEHPDDFLGRRVGLEQPAARRRAFARSATFRAVREEHMAARRALPHPSSAAHASDSRRSEGAGEGGCGRSDSNNRPTT
jgi:hypothetical protein